MSKLQQAMKFIKSVRTMDTKTLNKVILEKAGEDLARFCLEYGKKLMAADPDAVPSLMLMGYLIRAQEDELDEEEPPAMLN